jgi:hypothetical protein
MAIDAIDTARDKESAMYYAVGIFKRIADKYDRRVTNKKRQGKDRRSVK